MVQGGGAFVDYLWSPWRYEYITNVDNQPGCVFCRLIEANEDETNLIFYRGSWNFLILNLYPYSSGHSMVVPYEHEASLAVLHQRTTSEMMDLTKKLQQVLESEYKPQGMNIGLNLGKCAGAGVQDHVHMHLVPRWFGDANFMSVIGETRVLPEDLSGTYQRLRRHFP